MGKAWDNSIQIFIVNRKRTLHVILAEAITISLARTSTEFVRLVPTEDRSANSAEEKTKLAALTSVVEMVSMLFETGFCPTTKTTCLQLLMNSKPLVILLLL